MAFNYIMSLKSFDFSRDVVEVIFDISRYGRHTHRMFISNCNDLEAIHIVEDYLSEPMTREYFDAIQDDLFPGTSFQEFRVRGDALGDCRFLEQIKSTSLGDGRRIKLICGS